MRTPFGAYRAAHIAGDALAGDTVDVKALIVAGSGSVSGRAARVEAQWFSMAGWPRLTTAISCHTGWLPVRSGHSGTCADASRSSG